MTLLQDILRHKRDEIPSLPDHQNLKPSTRSFVDSLRSITPALIAECKPASPSAGVLIDRSDVPGVIAAYNDCARAISVLCDETFFGGGYDLLAEVRGMTDLPILAKEFIVDDKQIRAVRAAGADAVLLIAAILSAGQLRNLSDAAIDLGMAVLVELHDHSEIERIPALPPQSLVLGINNRDVDSLGIDLQTTESLAPTLRDRFPGYLLIAESGIKSVTDVDRLSPLVDGFLIGTGLLKGSQSSAIVKHLSHRTTETLPHTR